MRAVDTNLLVRLLADDDAEQADIAERVLETDSIFLSKTVILEFEWVMRGVYRKPATAVAAAIERMLATANWQVEDSTAVARALGWLRHGMDFADALHLASSSHVNEFVTFNVALRRRSAELRTQPPVVVP
jgi:predicted nucleic-acid-binding protein